MKKTWMGWGLSAVILAGALWYKGLNYPSVDPRTEQSQSSEEEDYNQEMFKKVDFIAHPSAPLIHGPCPIARSLKRDIEKRSWALGFENEPHRRIWQKDILDHISEMTLADVKKNLRDFVIVMGKMAMENRHVCTGLSEGGDLDHATRIAICDEIALANHLIKHGIAPALESGEGFGQDIRKEDRLMFEVFYKACRMTNIGAHRFPFSRYTRVAFLPTAEELSLIQKALNIDPHKAEESVCTYEPRSGSSSPKASALA